jgi:hypothetical protein
MDYSIKNSNVSTRFVKSDLKKTTYEWAGFFSEVCKSSEYGVLSRNRVLGFIVGWMKFPTKYETQRYENIGSATNYAKYHFDAELGFYLDEIEERKRVSRVYISSDVNLLAELVFGKYFSKDDLVSVESIVECINTENCKLYGYDDVLESVVLVMRKSGHLFFNI